MEVICIAKGGWRFCPEQGQRVEDGTPDAPIGAAG